MSHPDEEDGEAEPTTVKYKPEKLVSYPGFNDSIPHGVQDVSKIQQGRERLKGVCMCVVTDLRITKIFFFCRLKMTESMLYFLACEMCLL